jgi:protein phosphatase 2C family protein 2/3
VSAAARHEANEAAALAARIVAADEMAAKQHASVGGSLGAYALRGDKDYMEDRVVVRSLRALAGEQEGRHVYAAVFDGHGGSACAAYAADRLHRLLEERLEERGGGTADDEAIEQALRQSFHRTSEGFLRSSAADASGSTAVVALLARAAEPGGPRKLHVACAGDSRAVLSTGGVSRNVTTDHTPQDAVEYERIVRAGGEVDEEFGGGGIVSPAGDQYLHVARSLGDGAYKVGDEPARHVVTAEPDVFTIELAAQSGEEAGFVVLASDGVWDFVTTQRACEVVAAALRAQPNDAAAATKALVQEAEARADDNVAAAVLLL